MPEKLGAVTQDLWQGHVPSVWSTSLYQHFLDKVSLPAVWKGVYVCVCVCVCVCDTLCSHMHVSVSVTMYMYMCVPVFIEIMYM